MEERHKGGSSYIGLKDMRYYKHGLKEGFGRLWLSVEEERNGKSW